MSDDLRAACMKVRRELSYAYDMACSPEDTAEIDADNFAILLRFAQQQRAAVWREAAKYVDEGEVLSTPDELDARCKCQCFGVLGRISHHFEAKAQAMTP